MRLPVFDGHNDTLLRLWHKNLDLAAFFDGDNGGHLDLPRAQRGGFAGGLFAMFTPSEPPPDDQPVTTGGGYTVPLAGTPSLERAQRVTMALAARLLRLERLAPGRLAVCRDVAAIRRAMADGALAAVLHMEGAEAIDPEFEALDVYYAAGLRSLGLVWSRENAFGHGVPFRFPSSPDTGPGLTEPGKTLVRVCNERGVLIDLAHLNERGFWDVAELSSAPLVVSHSNAHWLCPITRNLTDPQLAAVRRSGGLVGLNFAVTMLRADGRNDADTPLDTVVAHIDHLVEHVGIDGVALGSDFDGCRIPAAIADAAGLPRLFEALHARGYAEPDLRKIAHGNWLRVLEATWDG